jgi:hypothetical protein
VRVGIAAKRVNVVRWTGSSRTMPNPACAASAPSASCNKRSLCGSQRKVARDTLPSEGREPLAYLASPQRRGAANCDVSLVPKKSGPTQAVLVTRQPLLPMTELLAVRGELAGRCDQPDLFGQLSVRAFGYH